MAERRIRIRPRGAGPPDPPPVEKPVPPKPEPVKKKVPRKPGKRKTVYVIGIVVLVLAFCAWFFIPSGGQQEITEDVPLREQPQIDLSDYEPRTHFYTKSSDAFYQICREDLRIPRQSRMRVLQAYRSATGGRIWPINKGTIYTMAGNSMRDALMIVRPDPPIEQMVIHLSDSIYAYTIEQEITTSRRAVAIDLFSGSLFHDLMRAEMQPQILTELESAFEYTIDMHHLSVGDTIKVVYDEYLSDEKVEGIKQVYCFEFISKNGTYYAFHFDDGNGFAYFNRDGRSMIKRFLKAPVKYTAITSGFGTRVHPIRHEVHIHKGIDFAAPEGTPIYAIADGIVSIAATKSGNGNYVKIKHDDVYDSQYLHMREFAPGIRPGVSVKQGEVIGFVGHTGSATGPHVCFRLWKENRQVNFMEEDGRDAKPMRRSAWPEFQELRDSLVQELNAIP